MKQNTLTFPIVGGGIAFLCFFLPWMKLDMSAMGMNEMLPGLDATLNISGYRFALGDLNFITLAFIASITILGVCIYMLNQKTPWKSRTIVLISSGIGVLGILFTLISVLQGLSDGMRVVKGVWESTGHDVDPSKFFKLQIGGFGAVVGFVIAFIGGWNIPKTDTIVEEVEQDVVT